MAKNDIDLKSCSREQLEQEFEKYIGMNKKTPENARNTAILTVIVIGIFVVLGMFALFQSVIAMAVAAVLTVVLGYFAVIGEVKRAVNERAFIEGTLNKNRELIMSEFANSEEVQPGLRISDYYLFVKGRTIVRVIDVQKFIHMATKSYFITVGVTLEADVVRTGVDGAAEKTRMTLCGLPAGKSKQLADEICARVMNRKEIILSDPQNMPQGY